MLNALAELPAPDDAARRVVTDQERWLRELFVELADSAGLPDPSTQADRLLVLHEGALAMQPVAPETLVTATALARELVGD